MNRSQAGTARGRYRRLAARSAAAAGLLAAALAPPLKAESQLLPLACPDRASPEPPVEGQTVVVLDLGSELSCALTAALATWNLTVVSHPSMDPAVQDSQAADRIANRYQARLVVWLSDDGGEHQLRLYDPTNADVLSRSVPEPPYDGATAAALALSVKTLAGLGDDARRQARDSSTGEPSAKGGRERTRPVGASVAVEQGGSPGGPAVDSGATTGASAPVGSDDYYYDRTIYDVSFAGIRTRPTFGLAAFGGVRVQTEGPLQARYGAELRWEFARPWSGDAALWAGVAAEVGPTREVETAQFGGGLDEYYGQLTLGLSHDVTSWLTLAVGGSGTLGASTLTGYVTSSPLPLDEQRWNGALGIRTELQLRAGAIALYLQPSASAWLRRQRYIARNETVLQTQRLTLRGVAGLMVGW